MNGRHGSQNQYKFNQKQQPPLKKSKTRLQSMDDEDNAYFDDINRIPDTDRDN